MAKKNFTISTVVTAPSPATSGTSLVVASGDGSLFAVNEPAIIFPVNDQPLVANAEIVMVTNVATDTLTITRTQESTSARTIVAGDIIIQGITAKDWNDLVTLVTGKITAFADPNADRIVFWDDSVGAFAALTASTGLTISGTNMTVRTSSATRTGIVELATTAETETGTDATRAVTPDGLHDMTTLAGAAWMLDEDTMSSNSATKVASQQSIKAYVDSTKFTWKGAWATSTAYAVNDTVESNGSGYICTSAHTSGSTTEAGVGASWSTVWDLFVEGVSGNSLQVDQSGGTSDTYGVLSGSVNGSNTVFTVSLGKYVSGSLQVYLNGQLQTQGSAEDWTETTPSSGTFTFNTAPQTGDLITVIYQFTTGATGNADTLDGLHASSLALNSEWQNGWISAGETWTYASADDPTYTFTISGDKTSKYSVGMKIKLTQTTVKYFIITAVSYSSPNTTVTVYGGTDYDLANAAITSPYYSMLRSPQGFPMSPVKWSVIYRETGQNRTQSSPTNDAWYNINSYQLSIPIGSWEVGYEVFAGGSTTNATTYIQVFTTLSTSTSSASDSDFTALTITDHASAITTMGNFRHRHKTLDLTSKATYYLLTRLFTGGTTNQIFNNSIACATIIRATCAYL